MAAIDDKIQATKFIVQTGKFFDQIRAAGLAAAAAASGGLTTSWPRFWTAVR